jgi:hypothetical protein
MKELAEIGISGIIVPDDYELEKWRVYFQGRLTLPKFSSRMEAMGYLCVLRTGNRKPEFARAYKGEEVRTGQVGVDGGSPSRSRTEMSLSSQARTATNKDASR